MAKLGDINSAGHSYAPGYAPDEGLAVFTQWLQGTVNPSDQQIVTGLAIVVILIVGKALFSAFGGSGRRY